MDVTGLFWLFRTLRAVFCQKPFFSGLLEEIAEEQTGSCQIKQIEQKSASQVTPDYGFIAGHQSTHAFEGMSGWDHACHHLQGCGRTETG